MLRYIDSSYAERTGNPARRCRLIKITVNLQKIFLFFLWLLTCIKVGENGLNVLSNGVTTARYRNLVGHDSVLLDISEKVLVIITVKY